jgi:hypothetical protein
MWSFRLVLTVFTLLSGFAEEPLAIAAGWHLNLAGIE